MKTYTITINEVQVKVSGSGLTISDEGTLIVKSGYNVIFEAPADSWTSIATIEPVEGVE